MCVQKEMGAYNLYQRLENLEGLTLALFTRFLGWSREEVFVFLTDVRKDLKNPRIHACYNLCVFPLPPPPFFPPSPFQHIYLANRA
jgi:hypothetical protein